MFAPKSFIVYRLVGTRPTLSEIQQQIEAHAAVELDKYSKESVGFVRPARMPEPLPEFPQHSLALQNRYVVLAALHQVRKVPAEVLEYEFDKWLSKQPDPDGLKSSEIRRAKEDIKQEQAPKFPPTKTRINGFVDLKERRIVWENKKVSVVERLNQRLSQDKEFGTYPGLFSAEIEREDIEQLLTMVLKDSSPEPLILGGECALAGRDKEKATFKHADIDARDEITSLIEDGFVVSKLAMSCSLKSGYTTFNIDPKMVISGWKLLDKFKDDAKATAFDDAFAQQCLANIQAFDETIKAFVKMAEHYDIDLLNIADGFGQSVPLSQNSPPNDFTHSDTGHHDHPLEQSQHSSFPLASSQDKPVTH